MTVRRTITRRSLIASIPAIAAAPVVANSIPAVAPGRAADLPFLHVLDGPIPDTHYLLQAGDMVLILPGTGPWDDMHLLRDGRFAAVQVCRPGGKQIGINVYGSDEHFFVDRDRSDQIIAGRVAKRIRLDSGRWID